MEDKRVLTTLEEVKAVSDPFRYRIIDCMYDMEEAATVKQIADKLGEVPAKVHYHIKKLEKLGIVVLEYTKEVNGIIAKYYKPTARNFEIKCSRELEESTKRLMLGETQRMIANTYDKSKDVFLDQIEKKAGIQEDCASKGMVIVNELYLTEELAEELQKHIQEYFEKHKEKVTESGYDKYHCFFSMIKVK